MTFATEFTRELGRAIALGGTNGHLVRSADPAATPMPVRFLLSHPMRRDEVIVNAYGINALVLTFPASPELVALPPLKFDLVLFNLADAGEKTYALESVLMRQVLNTPVAFTAYVRGKGE